MMKLDLLCRRTRALSSKTRRVLEIHNTMYVKLVRVLHCLIRVRLIVIRFVNRIKDTVKMVTAWEKRR